MNEPQQLTREQIAAMSPDETRQKIAEWTNYYQQSQAILTEAQQQELEAKGRVFKAKNAATTAKVILSALQSNLKSMKESY